MPAYKWWASWGATLPELREVAMRALGQPVGAGAGERNWSTYGFIVDKRTSRLAADRARKLVYAHFNVRLLRKVRAIDYHSEYFAWDVEDEVESDAEVLEVENEVAAESENSEHSEDE
jgi:hypothetical protein